MGALGRSEPSRSTSAVRPRQEVPGRASAEGGRTREVSKAQRQQAEGKVVRRRYGNVRLSSTTYDVEEVIIRRPAGPRGTAGARRTPSPVGRPLGTLGGWRGLKRLDWRRWQGLRVRYSHGQCPYVIVNARGREWAYPWDTAVLDILRDVTNRG